MGWNQASHQYNQVAWLTSHHYSYWISYQPAGRYWWFQLAAGAGLIIVALLAGGVALGLVWARGARVRSRGARTRGRQPEPV
jgi:hypothetical protein